MPRDRTEEFRCPCTYHPLLAIVGIDQEGKGYVHVKAYKRQELITEVVVTDGVAHIRCRECLRFHTIRIVKSTVSRTDEKLPESINL